MTDTPDIDTEAAALLDELERLADELTVEQAAQDDRYARRLAVFRRLTDKGVTQARIATAAKITPMAVSYALGADRRKAAAKS
jgi:glycerol-3-phosphate O-acyltransferase